MYKKSRIFLMIVGLMMMTVISFLFGFTEVAIPRTAYIILWFLCLALVDYAARNISMER